MSLQYRAALAGLLPGRTLPTSANVFYDEVKAQIARAQRRGADHIEINAGELHRVIGGYPGKSHRMPMCCEAMRFAMQPGDDVVMTPKRGNGASLTIRYRLPRPH